MQITTGVSYWGLIGILLLLGCAGDKTVAPAPAVSSDVCILEVADSNYWLRSYLDVLPDTTPAYSLEEILSPALQRQFRPFSSYSEPFSPHTFYWGKVQVVNRLAAASMQQEWVLNLSSTFTTVEVYTRGRDGQWRQQLNGTFTPIHQKGFTPTTRGNYVKLLLPPEEVVTIYFRGKSERASIRPTFYLYLQPLTTFYPKLLEDKVNNAFFSGFLLMMFLYNLIVFFFGRDRSFLYYSGYLLMVVVYACYTSNDLIDWLGATVFPQNPVYYSFFKLSLFLGIMCYLSFIRSFLDLEILMPSWDKFFQGIVYLGFPLMAFYGAVAYYSNFSYVLEDRVVMFYIALAIVAGLLFIYPLYQTHDTKGYFIVAGIATISIGFLLTLVLRMMDASFSIFYLKLSTVIEILIFSLGLAYRQRQQVRARQQADFELKESRLIQEKNQLEAGRLQELNDFKARFYTNITHEFRTPLTVIMGMSENIPHQSKEKELIQRNCQNLLRLINQLLDLSKLESGSLTLHKVHRDILVYLQYLTESFYSSAMQRNIRLLFHSETDRVMMDFDEEKIQHIVYNLLSNALKFTEDHGQIIFHASSIIEDGKPLLKLKVKDTGIGIPAEHLPHIFDRFYQVDSREGNQGRSTGVGLALTKELVELMGGHISASSQVGVGTELILYLPIEARVPVAPVAKDFDQPGAPVSVPAINDYDEIEEPPIHTSEVRPEALLIEDNHDIITYFRSILHNGYNIHTATNGKQGIEKALEIIPDIIISDVMMPEKDGYEVCQILKQDNRTSHIPIILLTAKATQADRLAGLQQGADAYLTKPFDKEELMIRLEKLVESRRQLHSYYANGGSTQNARASTVEDQFLQQLYDHLQDNLNDVDFGVTQLAQACLMSQMQLYRKLKALTGKTPSQFIRSYRLRQGHKLLKGGGLLVSEVAYEVGFSDPSYFSRMFQKEFGKNPSDVK